MYRRPRASPAGVESSGWTGDWFQTMGTSESGNVILRLSRDRSAVSQKGQSVVEKISVNTDRFAWRALDGASEQPPTSTS